MHKTEFCGPLSNGEEERVVVVGSGSAGLMGDEREREGERETEREGRDREKEREIETRIVDIVGGGDRCLMAYALRDLETSRQHTP